MMEDIGGAVSAAMGVVENAFQQFTTVITSPLEVLARRYWEGACAAVGCKDVHVVSADGLESTVDGVLYWLDPEAKAGLPPPEELTAWDAYVIDNGVRMNRVVADRTTISTEAEIWAASTNELQRLDENLRTQFESIARAIAEHSSNCGTTCRVLVTAPKIIITMGETPFVANIDVYCRCGFEV